MQVVWKHFSAPAKKWLTLLAACSQTGGKATVSVFGPAASLEDPGGF